MRDDGPLAEPLSGDAVTLEPMTLEDLDDVLVIERASFQTPWSRGAFRYELTQNRVARCPGARGGRRLAGYLCLWEIGHEIHVTNLATHPDLRRRGVGRRLLGSVPDGARRRGVARAFLEVRPTNSEALLLYERFGFRVIGRRKGYYFDTGEDALVMEARLSGEPAESAAPRAGPRGPPRAAGPPPPPPRPGPAPEAHAAPRVRPGQPDARRRPPGPRTPDHPGGEPLPRGARDHAGDPRAPRARLRARDQRAARRGQVHAGGSDHEPAARGAAAGRRHRGGS